MTTEDPIKHDQPAEHELLAIVSVEPELRVLCQQPGCGHGVYAAIHVVREDQTIMVLGSTCYAKRYGAQAESSPTYTSVGSGSGRVLTEEERSLLADNTVALVELFRREHEQALAEAQARIERMRQQRIEREKEERERFERQQLALREAQMQRHNARLQALHHHAGVTQGHLTHAQSRPWPWQHAKNFSVAVVRSPEGQHWVRVQAQDGSQKLTPWPVFDGWERALPPECGQPDMALLAYSVPDIVRAFTALAQRGYSKPDVGNWSKVRPR